MKEGYPQLLRLKTGGVKWHVMPGCQDLLFGPQGLRLDEWLRGGLAKVVKHGPHRTVYRVSLPELKFHLKHYRLTDMRSWLRQLVRPAKARREFERALAVAARKVPTIVPVGLGERCDRPGPNESYLITASLENAESISSFVEKTLPAQAGTRRARLTRELALALGEFVARLHEAGIAHKDLHAANVMVRVDADDHLHLYLIDLHDVHLGSPLRWRATRRNLIMLNRWFALRASRADRYRFWRAYCRARPVIWISGPLGKHRAFRFPDAHRPPLTDLARDLEERTWQSNLRFWRHRDRRCLENNRYYHKVHSPVAAGRAVRDLDPGELQRLLANPDAPFEVPTAKLLKDSRSSTVAVMEMLVAGAPRRVIYKRFRLTKWHDPLTALFRHTPALRSWVHGQGLLERCLTTARPLAVFHRRRRGLDYEGYLLTQEIPGANDLHGFVSSLEMMSAQERRTQLRNWIAAIARLISELHRRKLSHRDLKAGNILLTTEAAWLIDLVGLQEKRKLSRSRRVQNLARLNASFTGSQALTRSDRLRFLSVYLQWGLFGRSGWKSWWQEIEAATQRKIARNSRTGRPLA